jgi:hypothetical protein
MMLGRARALNERKVIRMKADKGEVIRGAMPRIEDSVYGAKKRRIYRSATEGRGMHVSTA